MATDGYAGRVMCGLGGAVFRRANRLSAQILSDPGTK